MDELVSLREGPGSQELMIGIPRLSDIPSLLVLTHSTSLSITDSAWRSLIAVENVVAARIRDRIVGLYVANHYQQTHDSDLLRELRSALRVLCNRFKLAEENVAFGADVVIAPEWQNGDLRAHLLRGLLRATGLRYRHLFGFCRKGNPLDLHARQTEGWRCYQEEDETCYLMLEVAKTLRGLASQLVLRLPAVGLPVVPVKPAGSRLSR